MTEFRCCIALSIWFGLIQCCDAASPEELTGAIHAAVASSAVVDPIDMVGVYSSSNIFEGDVESSLDVRFRMFFSRKEEVFIWSCEQESHRPGSERGQLSLNGTVIRNGREAISKNGEIVHKEVAFEERVSQLAFPHPAYWGVLKFPTFASNERRLVEIMAKAHSSSSRITSRQSDTDLRYSLMFEHDNGIDDTWSWQFKLPEMYPVSVRVERSKTVNPHTVFEQQLFWEEYLGEMRVKAMIGSAFLIRRSGKDEWEIGSQEYDLQVGWIRSSDKDKSVDFKTPMEIKRFIDQGIREAKMKK